MSLSELEYLQISDTLSDLSRAFSANSTAYLLHESVGLPSSESSLLLALGKMSPMSAQHLSRVLNWDLSTLSQRLRALAAKGLVEVRPDPMERRNWWVRLTTEGDSTFEQLVSDIAKHVRNCLVALNESEQATLCRLLHKISDAVNRSPG